MNLVIPARPAPSTPSLPRKLARRLIASDLRLLVRVVRRNLDDRHNRIRFAFEKAGSEDYPAEICSYRRALVDYPGQEQSAAAKRLNQKILASYLNDTLIQPGETFSIWHLAPRPSSRHGYGEAAALRGRELIMEVGGAICLLSTVLYSVALLGGLRIVERHCHSIDWYGPLRYFDLGRDAAIEYGFRDLRFSNPHPFPVLLRIEQDTASITARLQAAEAPGFEVEIVASAPELRSFDNGESAILVRSTRIQRSASGEVMTEKLPDTLHRQRPLL